jgi:glutathione S-transferase
MRVLYQFPISTFCEKSRWHLDHKGLSYRVRDVLPGLHLLVVPRDPRAKRRSLPVLDDDGAIVGDSTAIALHLEERHPERPLLPRDEAERARILELEALFDEAAEDARRFVYGTLMKAGRGNAAAALFAAFPPAARRLGRVVAPAIERAITKMYGIDEASVQRSRERLLGAVERVERETRCDADRYLFGDRLTLADVTAASALAPAVAAPGYGESVWTEGMKRMEVLTRARDELRARPAGAWVLARYAKDRVRT